MLESDSGPRATPIQVPSYRRPLDPRPGFRLFEFGDSSKDAAGGDRPARGGEQEEVTRRIIQRQQEKEMPWPIRMRYAGILLHPVQPIESRHFRALLLFGLSFLVPQVALFLLAGFLSCHSPESVTPLIAIVACGSAAMWYALYSGGCGPFDCGMSDGSDDEPAPNATVGAERNKTHKYLPARAPLALGLVLVLTTLVTLIFSLLFSQYASTLCDLRDDLSVNEAASFSTLLADSDIGFGGADVPFNDGVGSPDSSSTRGFFRFRDGFIQTDLAQGIDVTDADSGTHITDAKAGEKPTRTVLLAPIFAGFDDPFFMKRVPAWACGSIQLGTNRARSTEAIVTAWGAPYRFGMTLSKFDTDYAVAQELIRVILSSSGGSLLQFSGAPILFWSDPASLESDAWTGLTWTLSVGGGLFLTIWVAFIVVHARWYLTMLDEEDKFRTIVEKNRKGGTRRMEVKTQREEEKKQQPVELELAPMSPSLVVSSSVSPAPSVGAASIHPDVSRSASLSSDAGLLTGRPTSASGSAASQSWRSRFGWPFTTGGGQSHNSVSPSPTARSKRPDHLTLDPSSSPSPSPPVTIHTSPEPTSSDPLVTLSPSPPIVPRLFTPGAFDLGGALTLTPARTAKPNGIIPTNNDDDDTDSILDAHHRVTRQQTDVDVIETPRNMRPTSDVRPTRAELVHGTPLKDSASLHPPPQLPPYYPPSLDSSSSSDVGAFGSSVPDPSVLSLSPSLGLTNRSPRTRHIAQPNQAGESDPNEVNRHDTPMARSDTTPMMHASGDDTTRHTPTHHSRTPGHMHLAPAMRGPTHARQWQPDDTSDDEGKSA